MLAVAKLQEVLNQYFIRSLTSTGELSYHYAFTDKLACRVVIGGLIEDYLHLGTVDYLAATLFVEMDMSGIASSTFRLDQMVNIADAAEVHPLRILQRYAGHYAFTTGREIDETYAFFTANNVFVGKSDSVGFLKGAQALNKNLDAWQRSGYNRDFVHHIELPARPNTYSLLTVRYTSECANFPTHRYDTHLVYSAYDENYKTIDTSGNIGLMLDALMEDYKGIENITPTVLMEEVSAPWFPAAEAIFWYSMRCLTIDEALKDL